MTVVNLEENGRQSDGPSPDLPLGWIQYLFTTHVSRLSDFYVRTRGFCESGPQFLA